MLGEKLDGRKKQNRTRDTGKPETRCKSARDAANNADRYNHDGIDTAAGQHNSLLDINLVRQYPLQRGVGGVRLLTQQ